MLHVENTGYWHLYFVISTEALRDEVRSGEIFDSDFETINVLLLVSLKLV